MYLAGDAKLWWRTKYVDIQDGRCIIDTWEDLARAEGPILFGERRVHRLAQLKGVETDGDYPATHNFVSEAEAKKLGLKLEKDSGWMKVVNSKSLPTAGQAKQVSVKLGTWEGRVDFVVAKIDDFDVVLGMEFMLTHKAIPIPAASSLMIMGEQPAMVPAVIKQLGETKHLSTLQFKKGVKRHEPTFVAGIVWHWGEPCQTAFEDMKLAMINDPVLALPDISKPFEVQTDASDYALRGVLLQENHPVAYESHKLSQADRRYTTQEKEMLAVIHCLWVWRHYLLRSKFIVKTDNMGAADALSRKAELAAMTYVAHILASRVATSMRERIRENLDKDPVAQAIINLAKEGKTRQFWVEDGLLMAKGSRLFVPKAGDL
ncbi:Retrovirus-related Pol polyprotein from transposon gypsy [Quillaja saponaria]|uniref:Retrovirus-related Pol polyprotein from transposon gypsy n=1 Tax=Quillaja saponaria TaxID=32244 RepID=A0AAD7LGC8_QUISA|nr:Retrovirus-related Pol polyprotein from transposon gypsy [Quillaja saponaria]